MIVNTDEFLQWSGRVVVKRRKRKWKKIKEKEKRKEKKKRCAVNQWILTEISYKSRYKQERSMYLIRLSVNGWWSTLKQRIAWPVIRTENGFALVFPFILLINHRFAEHMAMISLPGQIGRLVHIVDCFDDHWIFQFPLILSGKLEEPYK